MYEFNDVFKYESPILVKYEPVSAANWFILVSWPEFVVSFEAVYEFNDVFALLDVNVFNDVFSLLAVNEFNDVFALLAVNVFNDVFSFEDVNECKFVIFISFDAV